jgi:cytochrome c peroxidase
LHETLDPDRKMSDEKLLERSFAAFKTPCLRGLAMSAPYMHNGSRDTIEDVIRFYIKSSRQARAGAMRNTDPELGKIFLSDDDVEPLAAFLKALNEDYE